MHNVFHFLKTNHDKVYKFKNIVTKTRLLKSQEYDREIGTRGDPLNAIGNGIQENDWTKVR
ncbi:MAG: hypothetical protein ACTSRA_15005 [Promethearchaeota archaeon]